MEAHSVSAWHAGQAAPLCWPIHSIPRFIRSLPCWCVGVLAARCCVPQACRTALQAGAKKGGLHAVKQEHLRPQPGLPPARPHSPRHITCLASCNAHGAGKTHGKTLMLPNTLLWILSHIYELSCIILLV